MKNPSGESIRRRAEGDRERGTPSAKGARAVAGGVVRRGLAPISWRIAPAAWLAASLLFVLLAMAARAETPSGFMVLEPYAKVRTRIVSGDPLTTNSVLSIRVEVYANETGIRPAACAFRVRYRSDALAWQSIQAGQLGSIFLGAVEGTPPEVFRDVATASNVANSSLTPACFTVQFNVVDPSKGPYSIVVEDDPGSSKPLLAVDLKTAIPHTFENGATTGLGAGGAP